MTQTQKIRADYGGVQLRTQQSWKTDKKFANEKIMYVT